jgi:16S rRNA (cytosine1402-N4)-methyltransferase
MVKEVMEALAPKQGMRVIDGTVGSGGHAKEFLRHILPGGALLGIDRDSEALREAGEVLEGYASVTLRQGSYADLKNIMAELGWEHADIIFVDLGFSSPQLETRGRGFSFMRDEPLLMTYDDQSVPVKQFLPHMAEDELRNVIRMYGGERYAREIAHAIREAGKKERILTSGALAKIIRGAVPDGYEGGRIDPATRTFQALRIYANKELDHLTRLLESVPEVLSEGGRVGIISFHSLEDDLVKERMDGWKTERIMKPITQRPVHAGAREIVANPRSRSAVLRVAERIERT